MIRIVVADDAADLRVLMITMLGLDPRFEVVGEAEDGEQAIALVDSQRPDVLLLDLAMPRMDGLEVLAAMQKAGRPTEVVVLSGFASQEMIEQALALGARRYIRKGSDLAEITGVLATLAGSAA